jgi:hypothetical protein
MHAHHRGWMQGDPTPRRNPLPLPPSGKKRVKEVFKTGEIAHLWAHQTQAQARNSAGNLFFEGPTIYSYGRHFAIATIHKKRDGRTLVLMNSANYSNTTAGHKSDVRQAARHLPSVSVPNTNPESLAEHNANIKFATDKAAELLAKAQRAMQVDTVANLRPIAKSLFNALKVYAEFFRIRRKLPTFPEVEWNAAAARAERMQNPDPVRDAKRFKAKQQRQARVQEQYRETYEKYEAAARTYNDAVRKALENLPDPAEHWRKTGEWVRAEVEVNRPEVWNWKLARKMSDNGFVLTKLLSPSRPVEDVLLRVDGDQIETSLGVRIPRSHGERLWRVIQRVMARGEPYQHNGHSEYAGEFRVDRIDVDGTLTAGCHTIKYAELERLARYMGLLEEAA